MRLTRFWARIAAIAVVFAFEVWSIATPGIWQDEASTISGASRGPIALMALSTTVDAVHSLYYLGLSFWGSVFGFSPLAVRLPSALAVTAAVALTYLLGRRLGSERLGITAAALLAILPRMTWAATEARSYGITALAGVGLVLLYLKVLEVDASDRSAKIKRRWWWAFALGSALASYFFLYALLLLAAGGVTLLLRRAPRQLIRRYLKWAAVSVGFSSIVLVFAVFQRGQIAWIEPTTFANLSNQLVDSAFPRGYLMARWFGIALAVALAVMWVSKKARTKFTDDLLSFEFQHLLTVLLLPFAVLVAASLAGQSLYNPRYVTFLMPFFALVVAWVLTRALPIPALLVVLLLFTSLSVPVHAAQRTPLAKGTDWGLLAQQMSPRLEPDDGILFAGARLDAPWLRRIRVAYLNEFGATRDLTERNPYFDEYLLMPTRLWPKQILEKLTHENRVWLVFSDTKPELDGAVERSWLTRAGLQGGAVHDVHDSHFQLWVRK